MRLAQVFISHSTKTPRSEAYLTALKKAFATDNRFVPPIWLDREALKPGDEWRSKIFKALQESDAAILLLSKEAVEQSTFLQIEASYLCVQRASRHIIPVLIDIDPGDLSKGIWRDLQIAELQAIQNSDPVEAARQAFERLKELINFDEVAPRSPWEKLRGRITRDFIGAQITFDDVQALFEDIKGLSAATATIAFPRDRNAAEACRWLADVLVCGPPESVEQALRRLREVKPRGAKILDDVLKRVAPFWVDEDTALTMGFISTGDPAKRQFGIGVEQNWTLEAYACRARGGMLGDWPPPLSFSSITSERDAASIDAEAESVAKFIIKELEAGDEEGLKEYLKQQEEQNCPVYVSFDPDWWPPSPALLAAIRKRLDCVTLCFKLGKDDHRGETDISRLNPAVRLSERAISMRYLRVKQLLKGGRVADAN